MILGYVRVSSADQARDDRTSLQTQTDIIEGFARTRGVDKYGVQIFTDAGVSGAVKLAFRPGGSELLKAMSKGDTVIASKLDRMFRSAADALNMFEEFKSRGVHLILFDMGTESVLESAIAKLIVTILAAVADMERIRIKERTADGRKAKKARGGVIGTVPFGYRKVGEGRAAVIEFNPTEAAVKTRVSELFHGTRLSLDKISRVLAAEGMVSRRGRPYPRSSIRNLLLQEQASQ